MAPLIFAVIAVLIPTVAVSGQRAAVALRRTSFTRNLASSLTPVDFGSISIAWGAARPRSSSIPDGLASVVEGAARDRQMDARLLL
ncbi:MAG: hypothetical protein ABSA78_03165 [Candidatus Sulfotelmatobacter sp.]